MTFDEDADGRGAAVARSRDRAHWQRLQATRSPGLRSAGLLCGLFALGLSLAGLTHAQSIEVQNTLISQGLPSDTGNGASLPAALSSADGRYVLFASQGANFVPGIGDSNNTTDVFLHDRATQQTVLVSRSATSATTTANGGSTATAISADGEWVVFTSGATNLVPGVTDINSTNDAFLYRRSTGAVTLVSRSAASATTTANAFSQPTAISADGEWVLFRSEATDLVTGVTDGLATVDVFLYERSTGVVSLVTRSAASATTTANFASSPTAISADGDWVLFQSRATDLVSGVTDSNGVLEDVFLYRRSTGAVSLVSRSAASATATANERSQPTAISADGEWVLFESNATNVMSGVTDSNGFAADAFLYQRSTGAVTLVSRSAASATTTASVSSSPIAISANGEWVLFRSEATNLVTGVTDSNGADDVFLYQRSTGVVSLVSRSAASATTTANFSSSPIAISTDGAWVLFRSNATNLVSGTTDGNATSDVFLYQRSTGAVSLISRSVVSSTTTANGQSIPSAISADGEWVLFRSDATDLVSGVTDRNLGSDVLLHQRSTGAVSLVSRSAASATTANGLSDPTAISADGEWVLFHSNAPNLVSGVMDSNGVQDAFLYQTSTGAVSLVSRSAASATSTANGQSLPAAISADGEWVLFRSLATNLVPGVTDSNGPDLDVFLYQRSTGAVTLVSRSAVSATTTADGFSEAIAISGDGEWVLLYSNATNLVSDVTDSNGALDAFLYRRSTGVVSLVSRSAAMATTANGGSVPTAISADGAWVLFQSSATDLVSGVTDGNGRLDAFLFQLDTGAVSLLSRSATSATATANGLSLPIAISADGEWVLFQSNATNLVSGVTDSNMSNDVFLHQRSTGVVSLVSRAAATATTANGVSEPTSISADAEWVLFQSSATNLMAGVTDSNAGNDVFLYQRSTGALSLVTRSATAATVTANRPSAANAIGADGAWVLFSSLATNLVSAVNDSNLARDAFLYRRSTGAVSLISRAAVSETTTANGDSEAKASSGDGGWVLFRSSATDVFSGGADVNGADDAFLARIVSPDGVFIDGFESTPPATSGPAAGL